MAIADDLTDDESQAQIKELKKLCNSIIKPSWTVVAAYPRIEPSEVFFGRRMDDLPSMGIRLAIFIKIATKNDFDVILKQLQIVEIYMELRYNGI